MPKTIEKLRETAMQLEADIKSAIAEEKRVLDRLHHGDAWKTLVRETSKEPQLYMYLHQTHRRDKIDGNNNEEDVFMSTRSVNGSDESGHRKLSFAEYSAMSQHDKMDCIRMGLKGKERVRLEL